jgi:hypothetical protein
MYYRIIIHKFDAIIFSVLLNFRLPQRWEYCRLGCNTVQWGECGPTARRNMSPTASGTKIRPSKRPSCGRKQAFVPNVGSLTRLYTLNDKNLYFGSYFNRTIRMVGNLGVRWRNVILKIWSNCFLKLMKRSMLLSDDDDDDDDVTSVMF